MSVADFKKAAAQCVTTSEEVINMLHEVEKKTVDLRMLMAFLEGSSNPNVQTAVSSLAVVQQAFDAHYASLQLFRDSIETYGQSL